MWLRIPRLLGALSPLPLLLACASGGTVAGNANVITAPELGRSGATNAYDAIRQVLPELLRSRESGALMLFTARHAAVAIDDTLAGGIELLRAIPLDQVDRIEYLNARQAAKAYGKGFASGIMLVVRHPGAGTEMAERETGAP